MNGGDTITYILLTLNGEYYCGKTENYQKRMKEHKNPNKNSWFSINKRHDFLELYKIRGDNEKFIKHCGSKKLVNFIGRVFVP